MVLNLLVNYYQMGTFEASFLGLFWDYADEEKFNKVVGEKAILWPLSDSDQISSISGDMLYAIFKIKNI